MKSFALNLPINSVSFGQTSVMILREIFSRGIVPSIFPIGPVDLSTQRTDDEFNSNLQAGINKAQSSHSRNDTVIKLWHINGGLETYSSKKSQLLTFFELDSLTNSEVNILKNQDRVYVTSQFTRNVFSQYGIESTYLPMGFDSHNFKTLSTSPKIKNVTSFMLLGKGEKRKATYKVLNLWAKKYGNNSGYRLNCSIHNPFLSAENQAALISQALEGNTYSNINFLPWATTNAEYNAVLQSSDIVLSLSGGEGRDLCAYHATALGAWPVALKAHAYLDYLNDFNAVFVSPNGKMPASDGIFFGPNQPFNQGNFFDFSDLDFYNACDEAQRRSRKGLNLEGLKLQENTSKQLVDILLENL